MDDLRVEPGTGEFPAAVSIRAAETGLLDAVKARAPEADDDFLEAHPPFFWRAAISNGRVDSFGTRMGRSSLKNYADDAAAGIPFMNSHRTGGLFKGSAELPLGRSLDAKFNAGQRTGEPHTEATFYTCAGLRLGEVSSDDFINGVKSGIVSDVSIGFMGGRFVCDLCDQEMGRSEDCLHFPGMYYDVERTNEKGKKVVERVLCTATVEDARLGEVSAVFKGSCPGAVIVKAQRLAEARKIGPQQLTLLEDRYRILLPGTPRTYTWSGTNSLTTGTGTNWAAPQAEETEKEDSAMGERAGTETTGNEQLLASTLDSVRAALGAAPQADIVAFATGLVERAEKAEAEVARLTPLASDGEGYRNDLVAQVVTEGKRAFGERFNEEQQVALLKLAPLETLKATRDAYAEVADKLFPKQRVTVEDETTPDAEEERPRTRPRSRRAYAA